MFSITADGQIFHNGVKVGTITHDVTRIRWSGTVNSAFTVNGRLVETDDEIILATSISAGGAVTETA